MLTDSPPKRSLKAFADRDQRNLIPLPPDKRLRTSAGLIESAMKDGTTGDVQRACAEFLRTASVFYGVPECSVRVLAARPLRVREYSMMELFGDYHPSTLVIRVWRRTAIRKEVTSLGTFLSTLCHEFCHHLDFIASVFAILGTRADFTGELRFCTTTQEGRRRRSSRGRQFTAGAGALTGRA